MVNSPFPSNLGEECRKAARTLRSFTLAENTNAVDSIIPHDIIRRAKAGRLAAPLALSRPRASCAPASGERP